MTMKILDQLTRNVVAAALASSAACSGEPQSIGNPGTPAGGASSEPDMSVSTSSAGAPEPAVEASPPEGDPPPQPGSPDGDEAEPGPGLPSEAEAEPVDPEVGVVAPRGPCELAERVGGFSIENQVEFGVVQGSVADGVVPTAIPRLALESGACKLLERRTLACIPACVGAETCGEDGACIPYPRQASVGVVTIEGLTKATTMSPLTPGNTYFSPGADNPPYEVASPIVLSAAGDGEREAFQLFGIGPEPLAQPPSWQLEVGQDLVIEWPAPTSGVNATVLVELTVDQHGASPLSLSCEFPDTGSASVPATLVDRMIDSGVSGFPNGRLTRRTADHLALSTGCVELVVGSPLAAAVSVAGFTPCNGTADCPSGQTCNVALQRCE
jgi:hypothetical protein